LGSGIIIRPVPAQGFAGRRLFLLVHDNKKNCKNPPTAAGQDIGFKQKKKCTKISCRIEVVFV